MSHTHTHTHQQHSHYIHIHTKFNNGSFAESVKTIVGVVVATTATASIVPVTEVVLGMRAVVVVVLVVVAVVAVVVAALVEVAVGHHLQKVKSGMGCPDWHTAMHSLRLHRLLWIYCHGHAGVGGNEWADRLASTADNTSGLQLGRAEVLRGLRNFLSTNKPEHHSIDRLMERGVEKGSGRHSTLQGREWSVFNQTNIGTVSRATLGRLLRDGAERVWAFPSATMPSWAETETETAVGHW